MNTKANQTRKDDGNAFLTQAEVELAIENQLRGTRVNWKGQKFLCWDGEVTFMVISSSVIGIVASFVLFWNSKRNIQADDEK